MNQMADSDGLKAGIHAEQDAINKLKPLKYKKKVRNNKYISNKSVYKK